MKAKQRIQTLKKFESKSIVLISIGLIIRL